MESKVAMEDKGSISPSRSTFIGIMDSNELLREKRLNEGKFGNPNVDWGVVVASHTSIYGGATVENGCLGAASFSPSHKAAGESSRVYSPSMQIKLDIHAENMYVGNIKILMGGPLVDIHAFSCSMRRTIEYVPPEIIDRHALIKPSWHVASLGMKQWRFMVDGYFLGPKISFLAAKNFTLSIWKGLKDVKAKSNGYFSSTLNVNVLWWMFLKKGLGSMRGNLYFSNGGKKGWQWKNAATLWCQYG